MPAEPLERVPPPRPGTPPRRHDTFEVLRQAQATVGRAEVALDIARETVLRASSRRLRAARREPLRPPPESVAAILRALLE